MSPLEYYQKELDDGHIKPDAQQRPIVEKLEMIFQELVAHRKNKSRFNPFRKTKSVKGLYLWGNVGIVYAFPWSANFKYINTFSFTEPLRPFQIWKLYCSEPPMPRFSKISPKSDRSCFCGTMRIPPLRLKK